MDLRNLAWAIDFKGDTSPLEKMDRKTNELKDTAVETDRAFSGLSDQISGLSKLGIFAVSAPIIGFATAGTKMALDLETAINKITTLADRSILPTDRLQAELRTLSDASGIAQAEIAESVYEALSSGVESADVFKLVESGIALTRAGFTSLPTVIDATTTVLNAYGDAAFEVTKIHDVLVQTQDLGKISVDELGKSMGRVIPTASSLGVNLDQLGAAYSILTAKGQNAQLSTTNLNALLGELGSTGSKSDEALRMMAGKSFAELTASGSSLGDVLGMLNEYAHTSGLTLKDLFGSMNAGSGAVALISDGVEGFNAVLAEMDNATGKTAANAKIMEDGWYEINKAITEMKNVMIDAGAILAPYVIEIAQGVSILVGKFKDLDDGAQRFTLTMLGIAASIAPLAKLVALLGGPLTIGLGVALAAGVLLYKNWDTISAKAVELKARVTDAIDTIRDKWDKLQSFMSNPIQGVINMATNGSARLDGSHAGGLTRVPFDGYVAQLHEGEEVLRANDPRNANNANNYSISHSKAATTNNIAYNPTFNIEVSGDMNSQTMAELERRVKKAARDTFKDMIYEVGLQFA